MVPFLKQVAGRYFDAGNLDDLCFVFPSKRAIEFFKKYIKEAASDSARNAAISSHNGEMRPVIMPVMTTMNEFFKKCTGVVTEGRVLLLLRLYDCYKKLNPLAEPLDDFIFWGDTILADFSDIDKYLADPEQLLRNVSEYKDIQDNYSYLTQEQREAIMSFVSHFRGMDSSSSEEDVKSNFLRIWNLLLPLYKDFNQSLEADSLAYEGRLYRSLAEQLEKESAVGIMQRAYPQSKCFVFVGLNALNECEKKVLRKLRDAKMAEFCWDYSSDIIKEKSNRSSFFMDQNVRDYPQSFTLDIQGLPKPEVKVLRVPSSVAQCKSLAWILEQTGPAEEISKVGSGNDCAIVLPDESLLQPLLNSIPETIENINVTMGFPITGSAAYAFLSELSKMQLHLRSTKDGKTLFYHKQVWNLFSSGILRSVMDEKDMEIVQRIKKEARFYIPQQDFCGSELLELLFQAPVKDVKAASAEQINALEDYLISVINYVGPRLGDSLKYETEFLFAYLTFLNMLRSIELPVLPQTWIRLLDKILSPKAVAYEGEPLEGLQVMGPLETRNLDFDNIILLSCNEGVFPKYTVSSSFIPPELRKSFGLPTYEYQDSVWAYYFYRMVQRCSRLWLLSDSRSEGLKGGEESRYIKQLELLYKDKLGSFSRMATNAMAATAVAMTDIPKPENIKEILNKRKLSVSSLQNYLSCPAKFYYQMVEGLKAEDEVSENLDSAMIGNVYHSVMQALYMEEGAMSPDFIMERAAIRASGLKPLGKVTMDYLEYWIKNRDRIKEKVRAEILRTIKSVELSGRDLVTESVIVENVMMTLHADKTRLKSSGKDFFRIIGLEKYVEWEKSGYRFSGYIDRLDSFAGGTIRVIDYKTGRVNDNEIMITEENAETVVRNLFAEKISMRPKIALQLYLYDKYIENSKDVYKGETIINCIYSTAGMYKILPVESPKNQEFERLMDNKLDQLLSDLSDTSKGFRHTDDIKGTCACCDFKTICGR